MLFIVLHSSSINSHQFTSVRLQKRGKPPLWTYLSFTQSFSKSKLKLCIKYLIKCKIFVLAFDTSFTFIFLALNVVFVYEIIIVVIYNINYFNFLSVQQFSVNWFYDISALDCLSLFLLFWLLIRYYGNFVLILQYLSSNNNFNWFSTQLATGLRWPVATMLSQELIFSSIFILIMMSKPIWWTV